MIVLKSAEEIEKIRESSRIAACILKSLGEMVRPGIKTIDLETAAVKMFKDKGCTSAFKGYNGFPAHICVSVNDVVVHGIPDGYILKEGDIVSIDVGVLKNGYYGDTAATFSAGEISGSSRRLIDITRKSLYNGIKKARPGERLFSVSAAVEDTVEKAGFSVVRDFVGHGIGREMHEDPQVPNFGQSNRGPVLKNGMVIAVEPMVNGGRCEVKVGKNGWTVRTMDAMNSAHFEHTIAVLDTGTEVLSICTRGGYA